MNIANYIAGFFFSQLYCCVILFISAYTVYTYNLIYPNDLDVKIKVYFVNGECTFYLEINCLLFYINSMFHISSEKKNC